jgi:hypothetical protein
MEVCLHNSGGNVISINSLDTIIFNAMEKPKLGEASLYKNNLFCSSALDEIFCLDNDLFQYVVIRMMLVIFQIHLLKVFLLKYL